MGAKISFFSEGNYGRGWFYFGKLIFMKFVAWMRV